MDIQFNIQKQQIKQQVNKEVYMKNKIILCLISFVIGVLFTAGVGTVLAITYQASDITYTPTDNTWNVTTVGEAINDLALSKTSDNYSSTEKIIGTWIDGKPIYSITINISIYQETDHKTFCTSGATP